MKNRYKEQIYREMLCERTKKSLRQQDAAFARDHQSDTDEQLLEYVRACGESLKKTPCINEIVGGQYLSARFGSWSNVIAAAGLPEPDRKLRDEDCRIYKKEYKYQEKLAQREHQERKKEAKAERRQKDEEGRTKDLERQARDMAWGEKHTQDTDEQLIAYVRQCASELGHSPTAQEVPGAAYIASRFGSWAVALTVSGLSLPYGVKPPNPKTLKNYLEHKKRDI